MRISVWPACGEGPYRLLYSWYTFQSQSRALGVAVCVFFRTAKPASRLPRLIVIVPATSALRDSGFIGLADGEEGDPGSLARRRPPCLTLSRSYLSQV